HKRSPETWVKVLLSRRGGRFARHPIFAFLVFNMLVRFGNGKISMGTTSRKSFEKFKQAVGNLTPETLREAEEQLEATGKCGNEDIDIVLRELEVFGFRITYFNWTAGQTPSQNSFAESYTAFANFHFSELSVYSLI